MRKKLDRERKLNEIGYESENKGMSENVRKMYVML